MYTDNSPFMRRALILFNFILILTLLVLVLRPVPKPDSIGDCEIVQGEVLLIGETGTNDVSLKLKDNTQLFYINRGSELGLDLKQLQEKLQGKEVQIYFPKYWTPLDWNNHIRHLSEIWLGEELIYSEIQN